MKKAFASSLILALLFSALVVTLLVNLVSANPVGVTPPDYVPPPAVMIQFPKDDAQIGNNVTVAFTVKGSQNFANTMRSPSSFTYFLDSEAVRFWPNKISRASADLFSYTCEVVLSDLSEGSHSLSVSVDIEYLWSSLQLPISATGVSKVVIFIVNAVPPYVSVLSLEPARTYKVVTLPLDFTVSEPTSWLGYSLDGRGNVTVAGNVTLAGLSKGAHELTVYATDAFGSTGASEKLSFTVDTPEPFPTTLLIAAVMVAAVVVCGGLLLYVTRLKRRRAA
jgi:hypothetical protein